MSDVQFQIEPIIVNKQDGTYLRYQIAIPNDGYIQNRAVLLSVTEEDRLYYYFSKVSSYKEYEHVVEVKLNYYSMSFAEKESIYLLKPKGVKIKLKIIEER